MVVSNAEETVFHSGSGTVLERKLHDMMFVRGDCVILVGNEK